MFDTTSSKFCMVTAQLVEAACRARGGLPAWKARRVTGYVDANIGTPLRIDDLANLIGLSTSHFCREFKRTLGVPAHAYIMRRRIEVAQRLMLTTPATLTEIALNCGMSDQAHFTRSFRRFVGETPQSWRRTRGGARQDSGLPARGPSGSPERALFASPLLGYSQGG